MRILYKFIDMCNFIILIFYFLKKVESCFKSVYYIQEYSILTFKINIGVDLLYRKYLYPYRTFKISRILIIIF